MESSTLAYGTPVQLFAELAFTRTVTVNGDTACTTGANAYAGLDAQNSVGVAGSLFVQDHTCDIFDINNPTALIQGFVGQELTVNSFLSAGVGAAPGTADAANTLRFFLTPIGDFTYSTASGNS